MINDYIWVLGALSGGDRRWPQEPWFSIKLRKGGKKEEEENEKCRTLSFVSLIFSFII